MELLRVAVPWNLPCYVAANGFHPLYRPLFEGSDLLFSAIDDVALARRLKNSQAFYHALLASRAQRMERLPDFFSDNPLGRRFVQHLSPSSIALAAELPGDLELHHTSPLSVGLRPFVLHCESFLPIFYPFWSQGMGQLRGVSKMRHFYGRLLRSETCLGILSHIPSTLDQVSRFFRDSAIEAKLHVTRSGLSRSTLDALAPDGQRSATMPVFLFTTSAHQDPKSFALRGGYTALLFAQRFLKSGRQAQFVFRAQRPESEELRAAGLDADLLTSLEGRNMFWLERFPAEREQLRLFKQADFLLLPSVNLHSVTLMQALAAGSIPVVTDTLGPENYVVDGETGIVLRGVREAVWHEDPDVGIPVDEHKLRPRLDDQLADQAMQRITELLDAPGAVQAMRERMRVTAERRFCGSAFRHDMVQLIQQLWNRAPASVRERAVAEELSLLSKEGVLRSYRWERLFESSPQPILVLDVGSARVYSCKGVYFVVRKTEKDSPSLSWEELSPLFLQEVGLQDAVQIRDRLEELTPLLFESFQALGRRYSFFRFREASKETLRPYKRLYEAARWAYRTAAKLRQQLPRIGS